MEREVLEIIKRELPNLITQDPQFRDWVWHIVHDYAPSRAETENRFEQMLAELRQMREEFQAEMRSMREEEQRRWEENQRRWEENQQQIRNILAEIRRLDRHIEQTIGALGARWGVSSEASFREALRAILEDSFGVKVERVEYKDESGEVFGQPDMVELDIIIRDGEVLACELKSSASRADVYLFHRKLRSYERRFGRKVNRALLISPMVHEKDRELARSLGIEVYTYAEDANL
ncbi:MAG: DUF3782 domain-containing protein [Anaerolineales bacterium]